MKARCRLSWLIVVSSLLLGHHAHAAEPTTELSAPWRVALHGGWWDVGADLTSPQGVFVGVGAPWVLYLPVANYSGQEGLVAMDASVGYRFAPSPRTTIDGKVLGVWSYDWGDPCGNGCAEHTHRLFFFPVAGIRHRLGQVDNHSKHRPGVIVGIDLSLGVWSFHHADNEASSGWRSKKIPVWAGVAFSQIYAGYEW